MTITTEDNQIVLVGEIVFDYYNMRIARITTEPDEQGWFWLNEMYNWKQEGDRFEEGQLRGGRGWKREILNGARICSIEYARTNSMYSKYVTDEELALARMILPTRR